MKARGAAVQGALAVVGLVAAYLTSQRAPEETRTDVVVLDVGKSAIEKIRLEDGARWIELTRSRESGEPVVWVRQTQEAPRVPTAADAGTAVAAPVAAAPREVRGNERAEKLYDRFGPLRASRGLGMLAPEKLKELGLGEQARKLEVTASGAVHRYQVSASGSASGGSYLRDDSGGKVYLLAQTLLADLDPAAQQLVDRRLHAFRPSEVDSFRVKAGEQVKEFVQTGADVPQTTKVAARSTPDKPDEFAKNWHEKVWSRLIVTEVLGRGELPRSGEPRVELRIDYSGRGKPKGWLELARAPGGEVFARSEQTAGWVGVHAGTDEILTEAKKITAP